MRLFATGGPVQAGGKISPIFLYRIKAAKFHGLNLLAPDILTILFVYQIYLRPKICLDPPFRKCPSLKIPISKINMQTTAY